MSASNISTERNLSITIDILRQCLSDPKYQINETNRNNLIDRFGNELLRSLGSTLLQPISPASDITVSDSQPNSSAEQISELINILENSWIKGQEQDRPITSSTAEVKPELLQHLLLYFLLRDKAAEMSEKQMIYWWVGQGLINIDDGSDAAAAMLRELVDAGDIEQVFSTRKKLWLSKYKLAMRSPEMPQHQIKDGHKIGILRQEEHKLVLADAKGISIGKASKSIGTIETLLNLDATILNIDVEWLRKMKNLKVLHLGRWSNDKKHMEVESVEFFQAFKQLKKVRYLSFKGLLRITELTEEICSLGDSLRVLDLQDCPNLERLPKGIGQLTNLTHLDLSECFLLDRIPKGIVSLVKLQVLKGFVITDVQTSSSCRFKDLANSLGKMLKKLSIRTRRMSFPTEEEVKAFAKFEKLLTLKVAWVKITDKIDEKESQTMPEEKKFNPQPPKVKPTLSRKLGKTFGRSYGEEKFSAGVLENLQKLEVEAIPQEAVMALMLRDNTLQNLKKLHVIGGEISDLTNHGKIKWKKVDVLKLKYLRKLHMDWMQLKASFPKVGYMEMVQCPYLSFFPCDHLGIWRNDKVI